VKERDDVHAVFFDAGYTLLCMDPPQETIFLRVCQDLDVRIDSSALAGAIKNANECFSPTTPAADRTPFSQQRVDSFWTEYHRRVLAGCAIGIDAANTAPVVYRRFCEALGWRVYDDVLPVLDALKRRDIAVGVISNWTGDLDDVLHRVELRDRFDVVIDSARFGHEKPHPEIFHEALRQADVHPRHAMHVGDSIPHDVDGALATGLRAVLLDRNARHDGFDRAPRVSSLHQLSTLQ
jgi:putative hydrolase of the HAD superfamily